jgi:hypothetical protein
MDLKQNSSSRWDGISGIAISEALGRVTSTVEEEDTTLSLPNTAELMLVI